MNPLNHLLCGCSGSDSQVGVVESSQLASSHDQFDVDDVLRAKNVLESFFAECGGDVGDHQC